MPVPSSTGARVTENSSSRPGVQVFLDCLAVAGDADVAVAGGLAGLVEGAGDAVVDEVEGCAARPLPRVTDPTGHLLPGSVNDTAAARHHHIPEACAAAGILVLADTGYLAVADNVLTPYRNLRNQHLPRQPLPPTYKAANKAHAAARGRGERGFATLKAWRIFTRVRACPHRTTHLAKAVLTLEHGLA
jgi:hypothetical protein